MTSLSELPDELQYSIAHAVDERTAVVNLSLACRALRPACLRVLFETFTLHLGTFEPSSPGPLLDISRKDLDHLRSHVRTLLLLDDPSTDAREDISRLLFKILPRFTGLHTVIASGLTSSGLWQSLFSLLCTAPHLTHLSLRSSPWIACPVVSAPIPTAFHSLTVGHGRAPPPEQQPHLLAETRTLNTFMLYHGAALRELTLPAELGMWAFLAGQRWPALTRLSLHGYPPMPSGPGPDLVRFLAAAPALASLSVDVARPLTAPQFAVWAAAHRRERVPPAFLGALRSLAVARPDPTDALFAHLPRSLLRLALLAYPRPTRFVPTEDDLLAPPTCAEVLGMLCASALPELRVLRLALAAPFDRSFVDELVRLFPLLEVLQLQELRMVSIAVDGREQAMTLAVALAPLTHLRELILQDLPYARIPGDLPDPVFPPCTGDLWASPFYNVALAIGARVRSLRHVVFLGGFACEEVCRIGLRAGEVETFWQTPGRMGAESESKESAGA